MNERTTIHRDGDDLVAAFSGSRWLHELRRISVRGATPTLRNGSVESLCVVLSGTHDLHAGGGSWARRGVRQSPFEGRPVALYLPPHTPWGSAAGDGELLVASVIPPQKTQAEDLREAAARRPLLPLLGSGKAFDPTSGEWKTRESFPESPEALLPRRIARMTTSRGAPFERILDLDYKARGLCVDEAALEVGIPFSAEPPRTPGYPDECALWLQFDGILAIDGHELSAADSPCAMRCDPLAPPELRLVSGRGYVLAVYAGSKSA
ncbi:MAG: 5-deoxy-glucuronate isomerase [Planctomycetota bacterium]